MGGAVGKILGIEKPKPMVPDTSAVDAARAENKKQREKLDKREAREKEEERSTMRAIRGRNFRGPSTLFALQTGVEDETTGGKKSLGG